MTTVLILEGNTPDMVAGGRSAGRLYRAALLDLDPGLQIRHAAPYGAALRAQDLDGVDGVVFTGSSVIWSTQAPEAAPQRAAAETVFAAGLPSIGSCNGMQLAAVVLGGAVGASANGFEIGLARNVTLTEPGQSHALLRGRLAPFNVPCIHRDEVQRLPEGAELLAQNAHSPVQAFAYETGGVDFWGMQYHPELRPGAMVRSVRSGLFASGAALADDLGRAEKDEAAAARLGSSVAELAPEVRMIELRNWLGHLKERMTQ